MQFLKNNYLRTVGNGPTFNVEIDLPSNKTANYHQVSKQVAEQVYENKQGKLYLMYSGGVDSEYALNVFLSLGIDITPVIIKLTPNYNIHDIQYALDFCQNKNLKPLIIDIDFDNFIKSGKCIEIALASKCAAFQLTPTFHGVSQLDGTVVMGSHGPPHMKKLDSGEWVVDELEIFYSVLTHFKVNKIHGCPFFLAHTPEQYLSFLLHPIMQDLANNKIPGKLGNHSTKGLVFNQISGFELQRRPKYTGYETIESAEIFKHENIKWFDTVKDKWWGVYEENYFDLIARLQK